MGLSDFGNQPPGATPLTDDDVLGLKLSWVRTQGDLNQAEADNILAARLWAFERRRGIWHPSVEQLLTLHKQMFGVVWTWAGKLRRRETSVGIDPIYISVRLHDLVADMAVQIGDATSLAHPADELAIRFHHRLVAIHPFPNGNGRHARLAADLLVTRLGLAEFTWGSSELGHAGERRREYLRALRTADRTNDVDDLITFARS